MEYQRDYIGASDVSYNPSAPTVLTVTVPSFPTYNLPPMGYEIVSIGAEGAAML